MVCRITIFIHFNSNTFRISGTTKLSPATASYILHCRFNLQFIVARTSIWGMLVLNFIVYCLSDLGHRYPQLIVSVVMCSQPNTRQRAHCVDGKGSQNWICWCCGWIRNIWNYNYEAVVGNPLFIQVPWIGLHTHWETIQIELDVYLPTTSDSHMKEEDKAADGGCLAEHRNHR